MATPKKITIFLEDGEPDGLKTVELGGWIGKSIIIPRSKLKNVKEREDCNKPAVYFLVSKEDEEEPSVYIGEAEVLRKRLASHEEKKEFWVTAVGFFSQGGTLTKAHAKYLESRCIEIAGQVGRFRLENGNHPSLPHLPAADRAVAEEFLDKLRLLLTAAGYPILQEIVSRESKNAADPLLICSGKGAKAEGRLTNDGFIVYKGSTATKRLAPGVRKRFQQRRDELVADGYLEERDEDYVFPKDFMSTSPTAAARLVLGAHVGGGSTWKTEDGRTCREIYSSHSSGKEKASKKSPMRHASPAKSGKPSKETGSSQADASAPLFFCSGRKGAKAKGQKTSDGFIVYKGSITNAGAKEKYQQRRDELVAEGSLKRENEVYVFIRDQIFNSPTAAARTILGRHGSGQIEWKTEDGKTYKEIYGQDSDDL